MEACLFAQASLECNSSIPDFCVGGMAGANFHAQLIG
jgi:hypothetical protein